MMIFVIIRLLVTVHVRLAYVIVYHFYRRQPTWTLYQNLCPSKWQMV